MVLCRMPAHRVCLLLLAGLIVMRMGSQTAAGDVLDPTLIPKYVDPLVIPPPMPPTGVLNGAGTPIDYYEIAVRQFQQQVLPAGFPPTTVWSYGSVNHAGTFNFPAFTIEAKVNRPVRVKWINGLVDSSGNFLPHLLPVDQTLHWANPPGGMMHRDHHGMDPAPYTGPVPIVTHVHGAHTGQESDGYPEAWYLPNAGNIPADYATTGTYYDLNKVTSPLGALWEAGSAVFQYPNNQKATTMWYHDHALGMTRLNVYAGPAGFYLLRGGPADLLGNQLPRPAPALGDPPGKRYYEIPIAIQDRSFNTDGSLYYPDNRAFFEGLEPDQLQIPFIPDMACDDTMSDVSPIWLPEFFGNAIVVNGKTWPVLTVEPRRYRFRLLDGTDGRFLILKLVTGDPTVRPGVPALPFWQIGAEGGFLPAPVQLDQLLMGPAERADVIVDFTGQPVGTAFFMINEGPDEPFGGGVPGVDFPYADPQTTGQVMKFVVGPKFGKDKSKAPAQLNLPYVAPLGAAGNVRQVTLNEEDSATVRVSETDGNLVLDCANGEAFGPTRALLGTLNPDGTSQALLWSDAITENPVLNSTEVWEIYNFTMDAHPIHLHMVMFQVVDRQNLMSMDGMAMQPAMLEGPPIPPEPWEAGYKDTVIAYPGQVTRVKARFDIPGLFVWHCHIIEHEDNEMMRAYQVVPPAMGMVIIDDELIDNGIPAIDSAAYDCGVDPATLVNDDHPTEYGNPPLYWNQFCPGGEYWLPTGQSGDAGLFAPGPDTGLDLNQFLEGTIEQACLDGVPDVTPMGNAEIMQLVGASFVGVVYDGNVSINEGSSNGATCYIANLQGARLGLFYFTVLDAREPQSGSSDSLYEILVRVDPVPMA